MDGVSLKSRAIAFAVSAGAVVLILSLLNTAGDIGDPASIARSLIGALLCAALCWACAQRAVAGVAASVDAATERLLAAAHGDLSQPVPADVRRDLPDLSVAMTSLFSQVRTNLDNVQMLALFDPVTQLANRTNFCREVERHLVERDSGCDAALFFIDLDGFKNVNDTLGHAAGDMLLARVAGRLREVVMTQIAAGNGDAMIGRLSGDEFTLFFPTLPSRMAARRVARAVQYALGEPFDIAGQQVQIGASIGVAFHPDHGEGLSALLRSADIAMYHAKDGGRGRVEYFSAAMADALADRAELESQLRIAIQREEFRLEFQPQIDITNGEVVAAEALVRWEHPERDLVLPASFVPLAEETGVIVELGAWVMDRACATAARWARQGIGQRVAINISTRELVQVDFFQRLRATMERHGTPPDRIEVEITETLAMDMSERVIAEIVELRAWGTHIVIDDFGTGYSNFARLKDLPVDRVKVDRSLVRDICSSAEARTICGAVIGLIHSLGKDVVVEGVESADQLNLLRIMGCTLFQGYYFAKPATEADYLDNFGPAARVAQAG